MAVVPFRSTVFSGGSISASGSNGHSSAGLLIFSSSRSSGGLMPLGDMTNIGKDVFLFISGSKFSRGTTNPGSTLINGDLVISGTAYYSDGTTIGGSSAGPTFLFSTTNGSVYTTGSFAFVGNEAGVDSPTDKGADVNFYVKGTAGSRGTSTAGTALFSGDLYVSGTLFAHEYKTQIVSSSIIYSSGSTIFGDSSDDTHIFNGPVFARNAIQASGSSGITGSLTIKDDIADTPQLRLSSSVGSFDINYYSDGALYLTNNATSGEYQLSLTQPDAVGSAAMRVLPKNGGAHLFLFDPTRLGSTAADSTLSSDTSFFVGGLTGSIGTGNRGVAVFGGDSLVSGSHVVKQNITGSNAQLTGDLAVNGGDITSTAVSPTLFGTSNNGSVAIGYFANTFTFGDTTTSTGMSFNVGQNRSGNFTLNLGNGGGTGQTKVANIVTGGGAGSLTTVNIGSTSGNGSTSINTPKVLVPGELQVTGSLMASNLTGSLTRLVNGTSYLVAGSNVTITSGTNGQVTISSTGGSGSPAGSNTYVQFNDSGSFGAASTFSFEKATNTLSVNNLTLAGNLDTQAVDARWYLKNNSADSLSFWDGSAGSRRFQINMGDGQERFIAYDGSGFAAGNDKDLEILHDGTDSYVKNSTGKLYISGSTSGVFVTGSAGLFIADGLQPTLTIRASTDTTNQAVLYQESGGDTYLSNQKNSGKFFSSVKTSAGVAVRYLRAIPNAVNYNTIVSFVQGLHDFFDPQTNTTDVNFFVGGKVGSKGTSGQRGTALFAGDVVVSGSSHFQGGGSITGSFQIQGSITPSADSTYTLGTEQLRWGHVYTGDLHLRNERGDWTILEEEDYLCVINNRTGKKYKMMLQPID